MKKKYTLILKRSLLFIFLGLQAFTVLSCSDDDSTNIKSNLTVSRVSLIPLPQSLTHGRTNIAIPVNATISKDINKIGAELLTETLKGISGEPSKTDNGSAFIRVFKENSLAEEGYRISVDDSGCSIYYSTDTGLLWGIQTMRQILLQNKPSAAGEQSIPTLTLSDAPKKAWRGFHIDLARHMFTMDYLKKLVDCLSLYKINKLQLHLTDDQGWRIEIKKYPALTEIGAWRPFDEYDKKCIELAKTDPTYEIDSRFIRSGNEYGGYYTQAQMKELIEFATQRGIEVIPEIDMPGHFSAAIKAFPQLSCTGEAGWGEEFSYPICAGKTENYPFIQDIISEVADLFPSKHFHIGGDEVEKDIWKKCERCQQLIEDEELGDEDGLQNYFIKKMADYTKDVKGKQVMVWDDSFLPSDPQNLTYTYWRNWLPDQAAQITQQGYPMIFMEWGHFYFSATPSDDLLQSLYEFEFEPDFKGIVKSNVLGFQACVWTEMIPNETKFGEHVFPSLQAFSELAWGSTRDWSSFTTRLPWHLTWLNNSGFTTRTPQFVD